MLEANFGPETAQPVTPEMNVLNQAGILVVEQPQKPGFFRSAIRKVGIPAVAGISLVLAACSGGDKNPDISINTQTSTPTAGASLEPTPRITPTSPALSPSNGGGTDGKFPTATPEVKNEVPCVIVPQEYCKGARVLEREIQGKTYLYIGLRLPSGVPIAVPASGELEISKETGQPFSGYRVAVVGSGEGYQLRGDMKIDNMVFRKVTEGEVVALSQDTGLRSLGDYNLIFTVNKVTPEGPVTNEELLRRLFPDAFKQPIERPVVGAVQPTTTYIYTDTPR